MDIRTKKRLYVWTPVAILSVAVLAAAIVLSPYGRSGGKAFADELSQSVVPREVPGKKADAAFIGSAAQFAVDLFKKSYDENNNTLVSPLSVMLALGMTAGGADGRTLSQMEETLGDGMPIGDLSAYLHYYSAALRGKADDKTLSIANSIWFRDDAERLKVSQEFLQRNADFYGADAYKAPFDARTLSDINRWVKTHTNGMIDGILNELPPSAKMYLINAIAFDAEWEKPYGSQAVQDGKFVTADGTRQDARMMHSSEDIYLTDGHAVGFIRPYAGDRFSFAAILPEAGTPVGQYVGSLTGAAWMKLMNGAKPADIRASLPKFKSSAFYSLKENLQSLGMTDAFDPGLADFGKMGESADGKLFIAQVLHKTFISVDEKGTKAAAVTVVEMATSAEATVPEPIYVELNRPFVYAIIDNATMLPIFLGTVVDLDQAGD